jgi:cytochrome c551/c552
MTKMACPRQSKKRLIAHLDPAAAANPSTAFALDGVSCTLCHQIAPDGLGTRASFTAGFVVDTRTPTGRRAAYGPFQVQPGQTRIMRSASSFVPTSASHLRGSELCASCHTLITTAFGPDGKAVGELPEQVPYLEWKHSAYRDQESCQSCHMPVVPEPTAISRVLGVKREGLARHDFRGANFFLPRLFNLQRTALGVQAPCCPKTDRRGSCGLPIVVVQPPATARATRGHRTAGRLGS